MHCPRASVFLPLLLAAGTAAAVPADWKPEGGILLLPRARVGWRHPRGLTLSLGASVNWQRAGGGFHGPLVQLDLGQHAHGLSAGWRQGVHMGAPVLSWGAALSLARSCDSRFWDGLGEAGEDHRYVEPGAWLAGPEIMLEALIVEFRGGVLRHLSGPRADDKWVWTMGLGVGL
jgi:hypothetical protein